MNRWIIVDIQLVRMKHPVRVRVIAARKCARCMSRQSLARKPQWKGVVAQLLAVAGKRVCRIRVHVLDKNIWLVCSIYTDVEYSNVICCPKEFLQIVSTYEYWCCNGFHS
jgi:hypothetical protein